MADESLQRQNSKGERLQPHHQLGVKGKRGAIELDVELDLTARWTVVFGPSGSGKSSLLRAACGLVPSLTTEFRRWQSGAWVDLQDATQSMPTHIRALAYAPQGGSVFPHMTVRENVEFGWRSLGDVHGQSFVDEAIALFGLGPLLHRMPRELSGGERQGVILARAFAVPNAKLVLLDEPFSGIDRSTRDVLLPRMRERLATLGIPAISVTHDVEEPLMLGADVVRLEAGGVEWHGPALEALDEELVRMRRVLSG